MLFASCTQEPASIVVHSTTAPRKAGFVSNNPYKATVEKGDTLYRIAKNNNVEIRDLIEINRLRPPYTLIPGQSVKLPKAAFHITGENDTLYAISQSYGVDEGRLALKNNLTPPYNLTKGQKLFLPSIAEKDFTTSNDTTITKYDYDTKTSSESSNAVISNDLAPLGAKQADTTTQTDNDSSPFALSSGSKAVDTTEASPFSDKSENEFASSVQNMEPERKEIMAEPVTNQPAQEIADPFADKTTKEPESFAAPATTETAKASVTPLGKASFSWPVKGEVISGFGPKQGGLYNDGINISAKEGTPIQAAEDGDVVYSGNELRGYGNMLLIKHNNGFLTAYAHAGDVVVKKGDVVKRGQLIAHVGKTGHVSTPQLHFSIRQGRKAIDPEKYLPTDFSMITK